jgi:CysZ protein
VQHLRRRRQALVFDAGRRPAGVAEHALTLFGFVAIILSSPFHGNLSAALEPHLDRAPANPAATRPLHLEALAALRRELRKLRYQLPRLVGVLLATFIPVLNVVSPLLWLLFGAWMLAVQFADLPAENRQEDFSATLELLRQNRGAALGFGLCVTPLLAIPIVNFVVVPLAVAGGTVLWHRMRRAT